MPLRIEQLLRASSPGVFAKRYRYSETFDNDYNRVIEIAKQARSDRTRLHVLVDDVGTNYGFIALSIHVSERKPCIIVDYLFSSQQYRSINHPELEGLTVGKFLLGYAYQLAAEANRNYPIRFIALVPANEKLELYYASEGFQKLDSTDFMYLKPPKQEDMV